jgi:hypothetical protein
VGLFGRVFHSLPNYRFTFSLIGGVRSGVNGVGERSGVNGVATDGQCPARHSQSPSAIPKENPGLTQRPGASSYDANRTRGDGGSGWLALNVGGLKHLPPPHRSEPRHTHGRHWGELKKERAGIGSEGSGEKDEQK